MRTSFLPLKAGRPGVAGLLALALAAAAPALPGLHLGPACASAAGLHHAAVVVEHGDGAVLIRCVAFDTDEISGEQLLGLSGIGYQTAAFGGFGQAVCQIDGEPASFPPGCWTSTSPYWALFVARGGGPWSVSNLGVSSQTFRDGDAEGFRYSAQTGSLSPPAAPGRCPPTAPQATDSPPPSAPTEAPTPAHTRLSAGTAVPSRAPTAGAPASPSGDEATAGVSGAPGEPPPSARPDPGRSSTTDGEPPYSAAIAITALVALGALGAVNLRRRAR